MLCQQMTFAAAARLVGGSRHQVAAIYERYVELALDQADYSQVHELAIDETSCARGHDYITLGRCAAAPCACAGRGPRRPDDRGAHRGAG